MVRKREEGNRSSKVERERERYRDLKSGWRCRGRARPVRRLRRLPVLVFW